MNDLSRRDLLTGMLQALLLALFPWLRTERGALLAEQAVERFVLQSGGQAAGNVFSDWETLYVRLMATDGPKDVVIDDSFAALVSLPAGTYDLSETTLINLGGGFEKEGRP